MGDHFQKSNAIAIRKQEIIREITYLQHPTLALDHNQYRWFSPLPKLQRMHQPPTLLIHIGSLWTNAQPSAPSGTKISFKTSNPVMQESNPGHTQPEGNKTTTTPRPLKCYPSKKINWEIPCKHTILFRSGVQFQYHHWHRIRPIHKLTPLRWHQDHIQGMWRSPILLLHNQRGLWQSQNYGLHLSQNSREQQAMIPQTRRQSSRRSKNTSTTCMVAINTYPKRSCSKKSNRGLPNRHRRHQRIRSHLWPP